MVPGGGASSIPSPTASASTKKLAPLLPGIPPQRQLSSKEVEALGQRLSKARAVVQETAPLLPPVKRSRAELQQQVDRLYTQSMAQAEARLKKLVEASQKPSHPVATAVATTSSSPPALSVSSGGGTKALTKQQVEELGARLCVSKAERLAQLKERYYSKAYALQAPNTVLPRERLEEAGRRMYEGAVERRQQVTDRLWAKYVTATELPRHTLPKAALQEASQRLCRHRNK